MKPNYIKTLPIHREMKIPVDNSNNPICGKNDLFAVTIIFKTMIPKSTFINSFMRKGGCWMIWKRCFL